jgi:hypothetical protein
MRFTLWTNRVMNGSLCFAHTDAQSRPRPLTRRDVNRSARVGCWPRKTSRILPQAEAHTRGVLLREVRAGNAGTRKAAQLP